MDINNQEEIINYLKKHNSYPADEHEKVFLYCKGAVSMACLWGSFIEEPEVLPVFHAWLKSRMTNPEVCDILSQAGITQDQMDWTINILDEVLLPALEEMQDMRVSRN